MQRAHPLPAPAWAPQPSTLSSCHIFPPLAPQVEVLESAQVCAIHGKRVTIMVKDMQLAMRLMGGVGGGR